MAETADIKTQPFYLKKAKLKGYKSIKDAEVEFCDGLNIIIGKNASGKSNLLEFLFRLMNSEKEYNSTINGNLIFEGLKELEIETIFPAENDDKLKDLPLFSNRSIIQRFFYDKKNNEKPVSGKQLTKASFLKPKFLRVNFIQYNIPDAKNSPIIDHPLRVDFNSNYHSDEFETILKKNTYKLVAFIIDCILHTSIYEKSFGFRPEFDNLKWDKNSSKKGAMEKINRKIEKLNASIEGLLPLDAIRLNPDFNLHFNREQRIFTINNLYLEFKLNGNWVLYSHLSDGTKRLFYIVSELFFGHRRDTRSSFDPKFLKHEKIEKNIFLFEEPELGIHPHQLHQLMTFIKEQSRDKQIILSTHSPMVLDVLGKDDLHRIIIASNDDPKKGSQFRHLTEEEKDKAKLYMEEYFLSDYWKHSDLEK